MKPGAERDDLAGWEWGLLLTVGGVATLGWGLVIAGFFALALAAARALDRLAAAWRGPRLPPRRIRLARRLRGRRGQAAPHPRRGASATAASANST
jgi:hypothetical protein